MIRRLLLRNLAWFNTEQNQRTSKRCAAWRSHIPRLLHRDHSPARLTWLHRNPPASITLLSFIYGSR